MCRHKGSLFRRRVRRRVRPVRMSPPLSTSSHLDLQTSPTCHSTLITNSLHTLREGRVIRKNSSLYESENRRVSFLGAAFCLQQTFSDNRFLSLFSRPEIFNNPSSDPRHCVSKDGFLRASQPQYFPSSESLAPPVFCQSRASRQPPLPLSLFSCCPTITPSDNLYINL